MCTHTHLCMGTKTISIMDDVYELLITNKVGNESFSEEIRRVFSKRKSKKLIDYFGILSEKEGDDMLKALEKRRAVNRELKKKRFEELR